MRDHYVSFRSDISIARVAYAVRDLGVSRKALTFNIVDFVKDTLPKHLKEKRKGELRIDLFDRECKWDDPAYASFNPPTLHVDKKIWAEAAAGEDYPRYVIAHEIGHLVLHDHLAKAFSTDPSDRIGFADPGHSAEWQANTFAHYFLLPDPVVEDIDDVTVLATVCRVPEATALERLLEFRRERNRQSRAFEGDYCNVCGNFSLVRTSTLLKCTTKGCGNVISRLQ